MAMSTKRVRVSMAIVAFLVLLGAMANVMPNGSEARALALGARSMLLIGLGAAVLSVAAGAVLGATAAYSGGLWDGLVTRLIEVLTVFPAIALLALLRAMEPRPSVWTWMAALAVIRVPEVARLARAEVLRMNGEEWMQAARAMGASPARVLWHHAGPHVAASLAQSAVFTAGSLVILDAAMTLLGLGVPAPALSWGASIAQAVAASHPTQALAPVCALTATVLALSWLADAVRQALDPYGVVSSPLRQRRSRSR
jgi:ABC-type dipeptide/oligopeptide/nickel transport system permease subunit